MKRWIFRGCAVLALFSTGCGSEVGTGSPEDGVSNVADSESVGAVQQAVANSPTAIGVIQIRSLDCPPVDTVTLYTDDEDDNNESDSSGWDAPDVVRRARRHDTGRTGTTFTFCRVEGANFKTLTSHGNSAYYYAVLKLGTTCPNGSKDVERDVDGETDDNRTAISGPVGPNSANKAAFLHFCVFDSISDKMQSFPDIGMPYAVFHDYDGAQPSFVLGKRWVYTDDEDLHNFDFTNPRSGALFDEFNVMIGGSTNTMFDMARVR